jgi:hypothetical protein
MRNPLIDQMLGTRLHAALLHPDNGLVRGFTRKERVGTEPLPVAPASRDAPDVHHRPERDVDALADVLAAHVEPSPPNQLAVPSGITMTTMRM